MRHFPLSLAIVFATAVPALAQPPANQHVTVEGQRSLGAGNPNQVVCRMQRETGSRLNRQRVCVTRQQWIEQRRADRQLIEKAQTSRVRP